MKNFSERKKNRKKTKKGNTVCVCVCRLWNTYSEEFGGGEKDTGSRK